MLSSRAVATTDGTTSLQSPVLVVVLGETAALGAGDEHALASTIRPASWTRESRERGLRTAADYTRSQSAPHRLVRPPPSPITPEALALGHLTSLIAGSARQPAGRVAVPLGDVLVARVWGQGYPQVNFVCHQGLCVDDGPVA